VVIGFVANTDGLLSCKLLYKYIILIRTAVECTTLCEEKVIYAAV